MGLTAYVQITKGASLIAHDLVPIRTFVVERQALIARALHVYFAGNPLVRVVGDASEIRAEDLRRTRPELVVFGLDNAVHDVSEAIAIAHTVDPDIRVAVLSSFANADVMQRSIASGADGFLVKDMSPNELDLAFRVLAGGSSYVDPRVAGRMLKRRYVVAGGGSTAGVGELTGRESDILRLIAHGLSNKEIGGKLQLSEKTIKNHISRIFSKLNVQARTQAAVYAIKTGMA